MKKYQQMLKMVYDEYMADLNALQDTLRAYKDALLKQITQGGGIGKKGNKGDGESGGEGRKEREVSGLAVSSR